MSADVKILVVDDDPMLLDFVVSSLDSLGYGTVSAMDAGTALRAVLQDHQIQVVIVDLCLGQGPTGAQLVRLALSVRPDLNVLVMSGAPGALHIVRPDLPDRVGLLPKPFRRRDLAAWLSRVPGLPHSQDT